jgi:hypothetical protein
MVLQVFEELVEINLSSWAFILILMVGLWLVLSFAPTTLAKIYCLLGFGNSLWMISFLVRRKLGHILNQVTPNWPPESDHTNRLPTSGASLHTHPSLKSTASAVMVTQHFEHSIQAPLLSVVSAAASSEASLVRGMTTADKEAGRDRSDWFHDLADPDPNSRTLFCPKVRPPCCLGSAFITYDL